MKEPISRVPCIPANTDPKKLARSMLIYAVGFFKMHGIPPGALLDSRRPEDFVQDAFLAFLDPYNDAYHFDASRAGFQTFMIKRILRTKLRNALKKMKPERYLAEQVAEQVANSPE